jgi:hypothetical protein
VQDARSEKIQQKGQEMALERDVQRLLASAVEDDEMASTTGLWPLPNFLLFCINLLQIKIPVRRQLQLHAGCNLRQSSEWCW